MVLSLPENKLAAHCPWAFCPLEYSVKDTGLFFAGSGNIEHHSCREPNGFPPD